MPLAQTEMKGIERTALGRAADDFIQQKERIEDEKKKLEGLADRIMDAMRKENKRIFRIVYAGITYQFEVTIKEEKLKCSKKAVSE